MCDFAAFCHWFSCSLALDFVCSRSTIRLVELGSQLSARPLALGGSKVCMCLYPQYVCAENQGRADGLAVRLCQAGSATCTCTCACACVMRHEAYDPVTFEPFPPALRRPRCASRSHARPTAGLTRTSASPMSRPGKSRYYSGKCY